MDLGKKNNDNEKRKKSFTRTISRKTKCNKTDNIKLGKMVNFIQI